MNILSLTFIFFAGLAANDLLAKEVTDFPFESPLNAVDENFGPIAFNHFDKADTPSGRMPIILSTGITKENAWEHPLNRITCRPEIPLEKNFWVATDLKPWPQRIRNRIEFYWKKRKEGLNEAGQFYSQHCKRTQKSIKQRDGIVCAMGESGWHACKISKTGEYLPAINPYKTYEVKTSENPTLIWTAILTEHEVPYDIKPEAEDRNWERETRFATRMRDGKTKILFKNSKSSWGPWAKDKVLYFSAPSEDKSKLEIISVDESSLKILRRFPVLSKLEPEMIQATVIQFGPSGETLFYTVSEEQGCEELVELNLKTGTSRVVINREKIIGNQMCNYLDISPNGKWALALGPALDAERPDASATLLLWNTETLNRRIIGSQDLKNTYDCNSEEDCSSIRARFIGNEKISIGLNLKHPSSGLSQEKEIGISEALKSKPIHFKWVKMKSYD